MDNILYTSATALMLGVFYSAVRHMHNLYFTNTQLIIRQNGQIQFLLVRVIELDKKIRRMKQETDDLANIDDSILDTILEEEEDELLTEKSDEDEEENDEEKENLTEEKEKEKEKEKENDLSQPAENLTKEKEKEITFEIVESAPVKTQKEKGWIRYLF
jgi:hypothetical protein